MAEHLPQFPNQEGLTEEAHKVNEDVDKHFKTNKRKTRSEIAHRIVKEIPSSRI